MKNVKVQKSELIEKLKENRSNHRAIFEKALKGYRKKAIEVLDAALLDAKEGRHINTYIKLTEPIDQRKDYDRAIAMLEMSIDEEIEVTESEFAQYVLDDWDWKQQFMFTNSAYLAQ